MNKKASTFKYANLVLHMHSETLRNVLSSNKRFLEENGLEIKHIDLIA